MKRVVAALLVAGLMTAMVAVPTRARAHHGGHFARGFAVGAFTGVILGSAFAPRVYYPASVSYPAPVYVAPAPV